MALAGRQLWGDCSLDDRHYAGFQGILSQFYKRKAVEQLEQHARKNSVLKTLSHAELRRLLPHMEKVDIETKQIIYRQGERIEYVYFPTTVVLSMLLTTSSGKTVELATVGSE